MDRMSRRLRPHGLTLVELLVSLVVLSITVALAVPSMAGLISGNRLRTHSSRLVTAINLARSEAILRNHPVSICPSAMAATGRAICSGDYTHGWLVFANADRDRIVDADNDEVIAAFAQIPAGYSLTNRAGTRSVADLITFYPDGSSRRNRTLLLCAPAGRNRQPWRVILNQVGRARVARGGGTCPVVAP